MIATAWHVIEGLSKIANKFARKVMLDSASCAGKIEANAVGVARLGPPPESDTGLVWVGKPLSSEGVNRILRAMVESGIKGGSLDLSGGGGVYNLSGNSIEITKDDFPELMPRESVLKGMDVGWLGYPSVASESPCFFSGKISGFLQTPLVYLIDGTVIPGLSGGPVFDKSGHILGIVSAYSGDVATTSGLLVCVPILDVSSVCRGQTKA